MVDPNRNSVPLKFWTQGVNSLLHPADISDQQYAWGENVINRGGIVQTRPGFHFAGTIKGQRIQGMTAFTPRNASSLLVIAVDGLIYYAHWPDFNFVQITGLKFNPSAPIINLCECLQSTKRHADNTIEVIDPKKVLIIGDGENKMGYWDGSTARHLEFTGPKFETPIGLWMQWNSSRLWIGEGPTVRVSDLGDPSSFYEDQFLATRSFFGMANTITGIIETANAKGLLVFTDRSTTAFQSYIHDRTTWGSSAGFEQILFPTIGCVGGRTACNQYGITYWYSNQGLVGFDSALNTLHTSKLLAIDSQMMRSKRNLSPDMSMACAIGFDNVVLISVPSGGKYNEQTWFLDQAPMENLVQESTAWAGVWTGIRPIQWVTGRMGGRQRLYCVSFDRTSYQESQIHLWEGLRPEREDFGGRIACQFQHSIIAGSRLKVFKYAEFEVVEMLGKVSLKVYVGGTRGPWVEIGSYELRAEKGSIKYGQLLTSTSILRAYKPQARTLRTHEFNSQALPCSPENSGNRPGRDKGFGLLFEWRGQMGIRDIRLVLDDASESDRGKCEGSEEGEINIVTERGEAL